MKLKSKLGAPILTFPLEHLKDVFIVISDEKDNSQNRYFKAKKKTKDAIKDILLTPGQKSKTACVPSKSLFFYITKHALNTDVVDNVEAMIGHIGKGGKIQTKISKETLSCKEDGGVIIGREGKESASFDPAIDKKVSAPDEKGRLTQRNSKRRRKSSSRDKKPLKVKFKKMGKKQGEHGGEFYRYEHSEFTHNNTPLEDTLHSEHKECVERRTNVSKRNKQCFVLLQQLTIDEITSHIAQYSVAENDSTYRNAIEIDNDGSNQHFIKKGTKSAEPEIIRFTRDPRKDLLPSAKLRSLNEHNAKVSPYEHTLEDRLEAPTMGDVLQECSNKIISGRKVDTINQNIQENEFIKPGNRAYVSLRGNDAKLNYYGTYIIPPKDDPVSKVLSTEWNDQHNNLEHTNEKIKFSEMNQSEKLSSESTEFNKENVFWKANSAGPLRAGILNTKGSNIETNVELIPKSNQKGDKGCNTQTLKAIQTDSLIEGVFKEPSIMGKSECEFCKKKFWDKYSLKCHMAIHSKEKPQFKCELCDYESRFESVLKRHIVRSHPNENEPKKTIQSKEHVCGICNRAFYDIKSLEIHKGSHLKILRCSLCRFETHFEGALNRHNNRIHDFPDDAESIASVDDAKSIASSFMTTTMQIDTTIEDTLDEVETLARASTITKTNLIYPKSSVQTNYHKYSDSKVLRCSLCPFETHFEIALNRHNIRIHDCTDDAESVASVDDGKSMGSSQITTSNQIDTTIEDTLDEVETLAKASTITNRNTIDPNVSVQTNFHKHSHSKIWRCFLCPFETHLEVALRRHKNRIHDFADNAESIESVDDANGIASSCMNLPKKINKTIEDTLNQAELLGNVSMITERNLADPNISIQTNFPENCGAFAEVISDECNLSRIYEYPNFPLEEKQTGFKSHAETNKTIQTERKVQEKPDITSIQYLPSLLVPNMPLIRLKRVKPLMPKTSTPQKAKENKERISLLKINNKQLELNKMASAVTMADIDTSIAED